MLSFNICYTILYLNIYIYIIPYHRISRTTEARNGPQAGSSRSIEGAQGPVPRSALGRGHDHGEPADGLVAAVWSVQNQNICMDIDVYVHVCIYLSIFLN